MGHRYMAKPSLIFSAFVLLIGMMIHPPNLDAQQSFISINPGLKFAYEFGSQSGFVFGAEISLVVEPNPSNLYYWGIVASVDQCRELTKAHIGIEGGDGLVGMCVGP